MIAGEIARSESVGPLVGGALFAAGAALPFMAGSAWFAILVLYADVRLGLGATGFGALLAAGAVGGSSAPSRPERFIAERRHNLVLLLSMAVTAGAPGLLLAAPRLWSAVVVVMTMSAAFSVFNVADRRTRRDHQEGKGC